MRSALKNMTQEDAAVFANQSQDQVRELFYYALGMRPHLVLPSRKMTWTAYYAWALQRYSQEKILDEVDLLGPWDWTWRLGVFGLEKPSVDGAADDDPLVTSVS